MLDLQTKIRRKDENFGARMRTLSGSSATLRDMANTLKILDSSMDKVKKIEEPYKQEKLVKIYEVKTAEIARKNEELKPLQEGKEEVEGPLKTEIPKD